MEKNVLILLVILLFAGLFSSCDMIEPELSVGLGNYNFQRGEYQAAILHYLDALKEEQFTSWIYYNLGNVYNALGESDIALNIWQEAEDAENLELLFNIHFNRGCLFFQKAKYDKAYDAFKQAIIINPSSIEAKINLEYSLDKLESAQSVSAGNNSVSSGLEDSEQNIRGVLEFVRRKEVNKWKATTELEEEDIEFTW